MRHLRDYGSITQGEALSEYGIMRLASRISELRKDGYQIYRSMVQGKNRYDEKISFARYHMHND